MSDIDCDTDATEEEINRARQLYAHGSDDSIEIDEEAAASRGDDGVWIAAWVWLPNKEDDQIEADAMIEKLRFPQIGGHK